MIYSHVALLMLRVFSMVQQVAMDFSANRSLRMRVADIPGDIKLGALLPIHRKSNTTEGCGEIWEQYGMHRTEVVIKTIREINDDPSILPNLHLGLSIRDSCWTERIAMEQTIQFVRDNLGQGTCSNQPGEQEKSNLAAVLGPGSSGPTIATQNLLQVFHIPQIGFAATSTELSDKTQYKYFMRVVPSDAWQARAIVDIVKKFGWSYIAVVYSERKENLSVAFEQDPKLQLVINAIRTVALGLDAMYRNVCGGTTNMTRVVHRGPCPKMLPLNGSKLFQHMLHVRFVDSAGQEVYFDKNGDPPARYDILNYQGSNVGYVHVGDWQGRLVQHLGEYNETLEIDEQKIKWFDGTSALNNTPVSLCSLPCAIGEYKVLLLSELSPQMLTVNTMNS